MGYVEALEHPTIGAFESLGAPFTIAGAAIGARRTCSPIDADGEAILREAGVDEGTIAKLRAR
jgi:crotonobetainyl-CoA:carnitine CoA-transferase CaiB-like acyl-CoA transferase